MLLQHPTLNSWYRRHAIYFRVALFLAVFFGLQLVWQSLQGGAMEYAMIHDITVRPAAALANWLTPDVHAQAIQFSLRAPGGGLNILNGCEGLEALFLLIAAFAVAPMSSRSRTTGLLIGIVVVFAVNQARILLLFYAYRFNHAWFDPLHATVTPIVVVLMISGYFYAWLCLSHAQSS